MSSLAAVPSCAGLQTRQLPCQAIKVAPFQTGSCAFYACMGVRHSAPMVAMLQVSCSGSLLTSETAAVHTFIPGAVLLQPQPENYRTVQAGDHLMRSGRAASQGNAPGKRCSSPLLSGLHATPYGLTVHGVFRQKVLGILGSELLPHALVTSLPEALQVLCALHRPERWRQQLKLQRHSAACYGGYFSAAQELLQAHLQGTCTKTLEEALPVDIGPQQSLPGSSCNVCLLPWPRQSDTPCIQLLCLSISESEEPGLQLVSWSDRQVML